VANEVHLTIKVDDAGSLNVVAKQAKAAAAATDEVGAATNRTSKARGNYHKGEKGVAGATANSTKAFSKMNATMSGSSGLVAAYASLAANVFALTAVFGTLRRAAQVEQLTIGMVELGRSSGLAMQSLSRGLSEATGNAISYADAMRSVATVTSAGLDPTTINRFGEAAKNISIVLGRDVSDSFDRLSRGVTKLEPELLDELGLFIRVDEASQKFAQTVGKSASDLTNFEKRLAFANETLDQAEQKFGSLDASVSSNPYSVLAASFADLSDTVLKFVNKALEPLVTILSKSPEALIGVIGLLGGKVIGGAVASLVRFEGALEVSTKAQKNAANAAAKMGPELGITSKLMNNYATSLQKGTATMDGFKKANEGAARSIATNTRLLNAGSISQEVYNTRVKNTNATLAVFAIAQGAVALATAKGTLALVLESLAMGELALAAGFTRIALAEFGTAIFTTAGAIFKASTATGFFSAALATLRVVAGSTIAIIGALGAAIAIALPLISLLVLAVTIGGDVIDYFKRAMRSDEENALIDRLEETSRTFDELTVNIEETNLALAGNSTKIKTVGDRYVALFNILSTARAEYQKIIAVAGATFTDTQRVELLNKVFSKSVVLQQALTAELGYQVKGLDDVRGTDAQRVAVAEKILEIIYGQTSAIAGLKDATEGLTEESKNFIASLRPKTMVDGITAQFRNLVLAIEETERQGNVTADAIETFYERLSKEDRDILGISKIQKDAEEAERKLVNIKQAVAVLAAEYAKLAVTSPGSAATEFARQNYETAVAGLKEQQAETTRLQEIQRNTKTGIFEIVKARAKEFETQQNSLIAAKQDQNATKAQIETLKEAGTISEDNIRSQIELRNQLNNQKIAEGNAEIAVLQTIAEQQAVGSQLRLSLEARIREITEENALLNEKITDDKETAVEVQQTLLERLQTQQKFEKAILSFQEKQLKNRESVRKAQNDIVRTMLEVNAAEQGRSVTSSEEAALAQSQLEAGIMAEAEKLELKVKGIDLEYDLLEAQFKLLKAEIALAQKKGTIDATSASELTQNVDNIIASMDSARELAKQAAGAETAAAIVALVADTQIKSAEAAREEIEKTDELNEKRIKHLQAAGREQAALRAQNAILIEKEGRLRTDLENETDPIAKLDLQIKLEENLASQIQNRIALREKEVETISRLQGGFAGGLAELTAGFQNQSEEGGVFADPEAKLSEKIGAIREASAAAMEQFKQFGPEGELVAAVAGAAFNITESWAGAGETIAASVGKAGEGAAKTAAVLSAVGATLSGINEIMNAQSNARIAQIDKEIAAEKKRDGKSAASVAKISALEKKKEKEKRKAFEMNKKMQMAQVAIAVASSIASNVAAASAAAAASGPAAPAVFSGVLGMLNGITLALGAAQIALIASTSYQGGGSVGGSAGGATSVSVGERKSSVDMAKSQGAAGELAYFRGGQGQGGPENFTPAFAGYKNRAEGGNTAFMVGEQGPELFVPERPGTIVPNDDVQPQATPINANINISAVDAAGVEDVLMNQRGNIISMIREAANAQGNTFLEDINVAEL